jgi:hypothetical protein
VRAADCAQTALAQRVLRRREMSSEEVSAPIDSETADPLNELTDVLVLASALVAQLKRSAPKGTDLRPLEDTFSRAITLTRTVRERVFQRRSSSEFASMTAAVRDVVGRFQCTSADDVRLVANFPRSSAIVAADASYLRRLVAIVVELAIEATCGAGAVDVDVVDDSSDARVRRAIRLNVGTTGELSESDARVASLRPLVHALGGSVQVRSPLHGGTVVSLRLIAAC